MSITMQVPIYFDYAATTPIDPRVAQQMSDCLVQDGNFGNPASRSHMYGWKAEEAVENARRQVAEQVAALTKSERQTLAAHGVRLGQFGVYLPALLKPKAAELRALLWSVHGARPAPALPWGRNSLSLDGEVPDALLWACGYRTAGTLAVRIDRLEALARAARKLAKQGPFGPTPALRDIVGCGTKDFPAVMAALGFRWTEDAAGGRFERRPAKRKAPRRRAGGSPGSAEEPKPCSPFAVLKQLTIRE